MSPYNFEMTSCALRRASIMRNQKSSSLPIHALYPIPHQSGAPQLWLQTKIYFPDMTSAIATTRCHMLETWHLSKAPELNSSPIISYLHSINVLQHIQFPISHGFFNSGYILIYSLHDVVIDSFLMTSPIVPRDVTH